MLITTEQIYTINVELSTIITMIGQIYSGVKACNDNMINKLVMAKISQVHDFLNICATTIPVFNNDEDKFIYHCQRIDAFFGRCKSYLREVDNATELGERIVFYSRIIDRVVGMLTTGPIEFQFSE